MTGFSLDKSPDEWNRVPLNWIHFVTPSITADYQQLIHNLFHFVPQLEDVGSSAIVQPEEKKPQRSVSVIICSTQLTFIIDHPMERFESHKKVANPIHQRPRNQQLRNIIGMIDIHAQLNPREGKSKRLFV